MRINLNDFTPLLDRETDDVPVMLLTLTHASLTEPVHISTDATERLYTDDYGAPVYGTRSNGKDYIFVPLEMSLPAAYGEGAESTTITIDNTTRVLTPIIRNAQVRDGFPKIKVEFVLLSPGIPESADYIVVDVPDLNVTQAVTDREKVVFTLEATNLSGEPFPSLDFIPSYFPALFKAVR